MCGVGELVKRATLLFPARVETASTIVQRRKMATTMAGKAKNHDSLEELRSMEGIQRIRSLCEVIYQNRVLNPFDLMMSGRNELEVFNSKVIATLMNPLSHSRGKEYLLGFVDWLVRSAEGLPKKNLVEVRAMIARDCLTEVCNEKDRVDISIRVRGDDGRNRVIIIENKMNGAPDQQNQLDRYLVTAKEEGCLPSAIVYLNATSIERPCGLTPEVESILICRTAYLVSDKESMVNGWLAQLLDGVGRDDVVVRQYRDFLARQSSCDASWRELLRLLFSQGDAVDAAREYFGSKKATVVCNVLDRLDGDVEMRLLRACNPCRFAKAKWFKHSRAAFFGCMTGNFEIGMDVRFEERQIEVFVREPKEFYDRVRDLESVVGKVTSGFGIQVHVRKGCAIRLVRRLTSEECGDIDAMVRLVESLIKALSEYADFASAGGTPQA